MFAIAPDGDLTFINKVDIDGMRGCHLSTDEEGKYLFVAGYHDGKVTVVHTHRDGRLGSVLDLSLIHIFPLVRVPRIK